MGWHIHHTEDSSGDHAGRAELDCASSTYIQTGVDSYVVFTERSPYTRYCIYLKGGLWVRSVGFHGAQALGLAQSPKDSPAHNFEDQLLQKRIAWGLRAICWISLCHANRHVLGGM